MFGFNAMMSTIEPGLKISKDPVNMWEALMGTLWSTYNPDVVDVIG